MRKEKKSAGRAHPPLGELSGTDERRGELLAAEPNLVSAKWGVIQSLEPMVKDASEPALPYLYRADLPNHRFIPKPHAESRIATGKGMTLEAARVTALGEAVERYSSACWEPDDITFARRADLEGAIDPHDLVLYAPWQYEQLSYTPYSESASLGWVAAQSLVGDAEVFVPAMAVYMGYQPLSPAEYIIPDSSNGLGAGATLTEAIVAAVGEVLERDAFLITWMNRLPTTRVDPWSHPARDMIGLLSSYRRRGVEFHLHRLPTDHPWSVFMAIATQESGEGPAAVVGLGADPNPAPAARKAVLEVAQIRPGLRAGLRHPDKRARVEELVADPRKVSDLEDHDLLYADARAVGAFDFLLSRPVEAFEWEPAPPLGFAAALARIVSHFRSVGGEVLWSNVTPPDMAALGIHTARAIVPGFQPIHFGYREGRLGGRRLYDLPHQLGLTPAPTTPDTLNDDPHPLA